MCLTLCPQPAKNILPGIKYLPQCDGHMGERMGERGVLGGAYAAETSLHDKLNTHTHTAVWGFTMRGDKYSDAFVFVCVSFLFFVFCFCFFIFLYIFPVYMSSLSTHIKSSDYPK